MHISLLNSKPNFHTWDEGVTSLLCHLGLLGHILDLSIRKRLLASETPRDTQSSLGVSGDSKDIKDLNILP